MNDTKKIYNAIFAGIFVALVFGGLLAVLLLPKGAFSENENRFLAQAPKLTLEEISSGRFMKDLESFLSDQFPLRDTWVGLKATSMKYMGRFSNNGVFFGRNGSLLKAPDPYKEELLAKNIAALQGFASKAEIPLSVLLATTNSRAYANQLPPFAYVPFEPAIIDAVRQAMPPEVTFVSGYEVLLPHMDEYIYFKTDHHWTSLGAYYAYAALQKMRGKPAHYLVDYQREMVSENFLGSLYSKSQLFGQKPDVIEQISLPGKYSVSFLDDGKQASSLYFPEHLSKKDKYAYFLDGNHALVQIVNQDPQAQGKLLLLKDSFAHIFVPFIASDYKEVHLIDLRYYNLPLSDYIHGKGITDALVLYSTDSFTTDINILKLGY